MHFFDTSMTSPDHPILGHFGRAWALLLVMVVWGSAAMGQETDFSPFARFGLGTSQGTLTPAIASMGGVTSVSTGHMSVNADQPASSASIVHPTFQGSVNLQGIRLTEGDRSTQTMTGGPGSFGLVIKRARRPRAFHLGLTPMTSKAFDVARSLSDSTLGDITESYEGQGGLARAYVGLSRGWRGRRWNPAGASDSVLVNMWGLDAGIQADHWFGDAIQSAVLDIEDVTFRDVRTSISSRHRATGFILGAEGYKMLRVRYNDSKDFQGSWMLKLGGTWSPARTLNTDFSRLVQSTVVFNGVVAGLDTSSYEAAILNGKVPQKWTLGGGLQWDGPTGGRLGVFVDHHSQSWSSSDGTLGHLMEGAAVWNDASSTAVGVMVTPKRKAGKTSRSTWRIGMRQSTLPTTLLSDDGSTHDLTEQRVSLGVNTPLKGSRSASQLHFGMDFGTRNTTLNSVHTESNLRLHVGVTLTPTAKNLWLIPRLYD